VEHRGFLKFCFISGKNGSGWINQIGWQASVEQ